jgi:transposase
VPKQTSRIVGRSANSRLQTRRPESAHYPLQQLDDLVITAPEALRGEFRHGRTLKARAALCLRLRPDRERIQEPAQAAKPALRSLARRVDHLEREIGELDHQLKQLVQIAAPRTVRLFGVGTQAASQFLVTAGRNINRLNSEGAFAKDLQRLWDRVRTDDVVREAMAF